MQRRRFLALAGALPLAGCGSGATASQYEDRPPEGRATGIARDELEDSQYHESTQSATTGPDPLGGDGFGVTLRYTLDMEGLGMVSSTVEDAEHRGGTVARDVIMALVDAEIDGLASLAIYGSVPTSDGGTAVSTKIVIGLGQFEDVDFSSYPWQYLRDDADQYLFNDYLYG